MTFNIGDTVEYKCASRESGFNEWDGSLGTVIWSASGQTSVKWISGPAHDKYKDSSFAPSHYNRNLILAYQELKYDPTQQPDEEDDV